MQQKAYCNSCNWYYIANIMQHRHSYVNADDIVTTDSSMERWRSAAVFLPGFRIMHPDAASVYPSSTSPCALAISDRSWKDTKMSSSSSCIVMCHTQGTFPREPSVQCVQGVCVCACSDESVFLIDEPSTGGAPTGGQILR